MAISTDRILGMAGVAMRMAEVDLTYKSSHVTRYIMHDETED